MHATTRKSPEKHARPADNRRVLVIDDNQSIHADFVKILGSAPDPSRDVLCEDEAFLFGDPVPRLTHPQVDLDSACQGLDGVSLVRRAVDEGRPYAMAFVDVRMPPGIDGIETAARIWEVDPDVELVICTAFSDYTWEQTIEKLGQTDKLLILKKPFEIVEVRQLVQALTKKWSLSRELNGRLQNLEELVAQRTEELTVALDAAAAASEAKSRFLANATHELRTPLTAILGFAEALRTEDGIATAPPARIESLDAILRNGRYLLEIINDVLDLAKIESGKLDIELSRCELIPLLADIQSLMRVRAAAKQLHFAINLERPVPETIVTDPMRLRQILINLVGNAIKFTEKGQVTVSVRQADDPNRMLFQVDDSGIGMTAEQLTRIFASFEQADVTTSRRFGGTGLGLAISKHLAELLGGTLEAESQFACGSTFRATIPAGPFDGVRLIDAPMAELTSRQTGTELVVDPASLPRLDCRVLLAEDGPDNQRLISFFLTKAGATVVIAHNGQQAADLALAAQNDHQPFDVVLMDMQMPVLDGYAATRLLRNNNYRGRIVGLTAHAMLGDRDRVLQCGCDYYLSKPIDRESLITTVAALL